MTEDHQIAVLVGNLPPEVHGDDLQDAFEGLGYALDITLVREGDENRVTAIVRFDAMTRSVTDQLVERLAIRTTVRSPKIARAPGRGLNDSMV